MWAKGGSVARKRRNPLKYTPRNKRFAQWRFDKAEPPRDWEYDRKYYVDFLVEYAADVRIWDSVERRITQKVITWAGDELITRGEMEREIMSNLENVIKYDVIDEDETLDYSVPIEIDVLDVKMIPFRLWRGKRES